MGDWGFPGYADIHCGADRALFSHAHCVRPNSGWVVLAKD